MTTRIDLRTNDTRERIMKEAKRLYLVGGYTHLSMDKIAETLSIKRPTLYYHFPGGKEQLLVETIRAFTIEQMAVWSAAIQAGHDTRSRLKNIISTIFEYPLPENKRSILIELWQLGDEVKTVVKQTYEQLYNLMLGVFQEGIEKGEIREVDPELALSSFIGLYDMVAFFIATKTNFPELSPIVNKVELNVLIDQMFDLWMGGLERKPSQA